MEAIRAEDIDLRERHSDLPLQKRGSQRRLIFESQSAQPGAITIDAPDKKPALSHHPLGSDVFLRFELGERPLLELGEGMTAEEETIVEVQNPAG
jgi:hypothetical protein